MTRAGRAVFLAVLLTACSGAARAAEGDLWGRPIVSVSVVSDGPLELGEVTPLVTLRVGQPLQEEDTASTLRGLYATQRFGDARIEATSEGDGVAVMVILFHAFRVHPLSFSGRLIVSRAQLRQALPFPADALYSGQNVEDGATAIERRLQAEGYLQAHAVPEVTFDRKHFQARVLYRIDSGPASPAAPPFFDGETAPFTAAELTQRVKLKPGNRYRESVARADAAKMTDFLRSKERDRAFVELIAAQPTDDGRVTPVYRVRVGPRVVFEATGMKPTKLAKELRSLAETQAIDEELVLQYVEARRESLQSSGHYRASVKYVYDAKTDPNLTRIRVDVVEGPKFFVESVRFEGNAGVPTKTLYGLMITHRKGLPILAPGRLADTVLAADADTILAYYQSLGWVRAKVKPPVVTDGAKPGSLVVTVAIEEGPRALVDSRTLEGADHLETATAEKLLSIHAGEPFNPNAVREDVGRLTGWYHDRGFREAAVHDEMALSDDGTKATVVYRVDEGLKSFFGKTIVRGNTRTSTFRIRRLVAWKEGDPVSESKLLDTQRALSRASVFRRVEVKPQRPDPATQVRNVDIEVEEARPWSLLYGVGYQYSPNVTSNQNDPYLASGVSYNNVFGQMITAGLEAQYAPISGRGRIQAALRQPFLFGTSYPLNALGFYSRELINTVELERTGLTLESSKIVARGFRIGLRFTYERIRPTNPDGISYIDRVNLPAINQPIHEAVVGPDFLFDRRDDIVDPGSGYYFSGSYKVAFPLLAASVRFQKFSTQAVRFVRLPFKSVLVVSGRIGGVFDVSPDAASAADCQKNPDANCVPIAERFFAGGRSNERAFDTDVLGLPGQTVDYTTLATPHTGKGNGTCAQTYPDLSTYDCSFGPRIVGGNGFLALNAELRIPIAGNLAGVAFYDAAQVWSRLSELRFTFEGDAGLRQGVGVGLRYMTPIGPVRVEYGWPLSRRTIPFDVQQPVTDANGQTTFIPLGHPRTVMDKGHFFFSVGYPF